MYYEFTPVRTHKFTRALIPDFSGWGRTPAIASHHTSDVRSGWHTVQEGATASILWDDFIMGRLSKKEIQEAKHDLLKYCERDTCAMVEIWRHLRSLVVV
jgi:hypothetical protein